MGKVLISSNFMTGIADAVRNKLGTTDKIETSALAEKILSISDGIPLSVLADGYSSVNTYSINDIVTYQNKLYICVSDISESEDFDPSHWSETTVAGVLSDIIKAGVADDRYY